MPQKGFCSVTVIVATLNRAEQICNCVRSFESLLLDRISDWEIIVVDNGSTDDTAARLASLQETSDLPLRYILEPTPGVSAARNTGIRAAKHDILAFTDDDCRVDPGWLSAVAQGFGSDPSIKMMGGRVDLFDPEDYEISTRRFDDRAEIKTIDDMFTRLIGCNVAISAAALRETGAFDTAMGPGTTFKAGEDHELFYRILKSGGKVVYEPAMRIEHAHGRRDIAEVQALKANYVKGRATIFGKHIRAGDRDLIKRVYWELRAYLSTRERPDGSASSREPTAVGIYIASLVRGFLFLH